MRYRHLLSLSFILPLSLTAGCGNFNSIFRKFDVNGGKSALIDVKQRAIISTQQTNNGITSTIVCAEPSPDALSAYAAELAAEGTIPESVSVQLTAAFQESSSFVGLRTQSIQLLRDALYRLCEGYMSGALEKSQYDILMRRYQKYMVALLGIEQLTGITKAPAITINTQGAAEAARSLSAMRAEIKAIDEKTRDLEKKKSVTDLAPELKKEIDTNLEALKGDKEAISKAIENARGLSSSGTSTATVQLIGQPTQRSDEHIQAVAGAVKEIVLEIINTDDTGQLCFSHLVSGGKPDLTPICVQYLNDINRNNKIRLDIEEKLTSGNLTAEERQELKERLKSIKGHGAELRSIRQVPPANQ